MQGGSRGADSNAFVCMHAGERKESSGYTPIPVHELIAVLNAARTQYLEVIDSTLPTVAASLPDRLEETCSDNPGETETIQLQHFDSTKPPELHSEWEEVVRNLAVSQNLHGLCVCANVIPINDILTSELNLPFLLLLLLFTFTFTF